MKVSTSSQDARPTRPFHLAIPAIALATASLVAVPAARAGGMALTLQNGSQLGQIFSGGASAEDPSTVYFNPAGMTWLSKPEVVGGVNFVTSSGGFTNNGSTTATVLPTVGGDGGTALASSVVPSLYAAWPLNERLALGLGVSAPFGLATDYDAGWVGRYHALKSELTTINISPAIAWRPMPTLGLGLGLDWQRASATLSNAIDFGLLGYLYEISGFAPQSADGMVSIKGNDTATGFHLGAIYEPVPGTRIGLNFRSRMDQHLEGRATFTGVPTVFAAMFNDQQAHADLPLPEIVSLSVHHSITESLAVTADWSWWNWSRFSGLSVDFENAATPDSTLRQDWKDSSIWSIGARWRMRDALQLRAGLAYNETPIPSAELRSPRIPDSDRVWVGFGATTYWVNGLRGDFGYAHLFLKDASTTIDDGAGHVLIGDYSVGIDILSAQISWQF